MASVHRKQNSPFWLAKFRASDGRVVMRSTKQRKRNHAQEIANQWERDARKLREGQFVESTYLRNLNELRERIGLEAIATSTVKDFFDGWLRSKQTRGSAGSTISRYKSILDTFVSSLGQRRLTGIGTITASDVQRFHDNELAAGKGPTTADFSVKIIRGVLNSARRQGQITSNPAENVEMVQARGEQRRPFTQTQLRALVSHADGEWAGMILFGNHCGMRLSDAAQLTWANIDLAAQTVTYQPQKGRRRLSPQSTKRRVFLHDELRNYLAQLASTDDPEAPLFPSLYGRRTGSHGGLSTAFVRLMQRAGIGREPGVEKEGKGRRFNALGFHSLRHTFISNLANHDVPADVRKEIAGHSTDEIHRRYVHLAIETQQRAIARIPSIGA
jgi:integrase